MKWVNPFQVAAHLKAAAADAACARQAARADLHHALARDAAAGRQERTAAAQAKTLSEMDARNHYSESLTYSFLQKGRHS